MHENLSATGPNSQPTTRNQVPATTNEEPGTRNQKPETNIPRRRGRPTSFTDETVDLICHFIREEGLSVSAAAARANIGVATISRWRERHPELVDDLACAREEFRAAKLAIIRHATMHDGRPDWRAAAWELERRFPEDYARNRPVREDELLRRWRKDDEERERSEAIHRAWARFHPSPPAPVPAVVAAPTPAPAETAETAESGHRPPPHVSYASHISHPSYAPPPPPGPRPTPKTPDGAFQNFQNSPAPLSSSPLPGHPQPSAPRAIPGAPAQDPKPATRNSPATPFRNFRNSPPAASPKVPASSGESSAPLSKNLAHPIAKPAQNPLASAIIPPPPVKPPLDDGLWLHSTGAALGDPPTFPSSNPETNLLDRYSL